MNKKVRSLRANGGDGTQKRAKLQASNRPSFPIVGVGASAGGVDALKRLVENLTADTGMSFVLVQHLDPTHESHLTEILSHGTAMPVEEVKDGIRVKPNHIYVIPPNREIFLRDGTLGLEPRKAWPAYRPIDSLFRSLADVQQRNAIGVILSGTASDGTAGIQAIKQSGGATFAQDAASAKHFGMPCSAIATGCVDFVLPPELIAKRLVSIGRRANASDEVQNEPEDALQQLFGLVKTSYSVDLNAYKRLFVNGRIRSRMESHTLRSLEEYVELLKNEPEELRQLCQDLFTSHTGSFQNLVVFEALKKLVFPGIIKERAAGLPIRIWVAGCSTGESVYSIAILLLEYLSKRHCQFPVRIFGTDISEETITKARRGNYGNEIAQPVGKERLARFFFKTDDGYAVSKAVRDCCVFARHDITSSAPFAHLDLLSCQNSIISFAAPVQRSLIQLLHYSLNPAGFLMLDAIETVDGFGEWFVVVDQKSPIYKKRPRRPRFEFAHLFHPASETLANARTVGRDSDPHREAADMSILNHYAPPSVLVNEKMEILQFRGHTGPYLELPEGEPSLKLFKMVRKDLVLGLQTTISTALKKGLPSRSSGVRVNIDDSDQIVHIRVVPIQAANSEVRTFLVLFENALSEPRASWQERQIPAPARSKEVSTSSADLNEELKATKARLQIVVENDESREELKIVNEELLAANEELRCTTEEMEASNAELQSANAELDLLNQELLRRNADVSRAQDDILNLLKTMNVSIVFVDRELHIRRITPAAEKIFHLIPGDVGRPLTDVQLGLQIPNLEQLLLEAVRTSKVSRQEVQHRDGRWYSLEIRPYATAENRIDGAVLTLTDIHEIRRTEELAEANRCLQQELQMRQRAEEAVRGGEERFRLIADSLTALLSYVDADQRYVFNNKAYEEWFGFSLRELRGRAVESVVGEEAYQVKRPYLEKALAGGERSSFEGYIPYQRAGRRYVHADYVPHTDGSGEVVGCYLLVTDLTELKAAEERFRAFVESAPEAMLIVGADGNIRIANGVAERIFGYGRNELSGQPVEILLPREARDRHIAHRTTYMRNVAPRPMGIGLELYGSCKNGRRFPVEVSLSPVETMAGVEILSCIRDITDRKHAEQQGKRAAVLEERNRLARDIHDSLAQGLTGIVLQLEAAEGVLPAGLPELQKHISQARKLGRDSLQEARRSLLAIRSPGSDVTGLCEAIEQMVSDLRQETSARIEVSLHRSHRVLPFAVHENLQRIAHEALRNAIRHGKANVVRLKLECAANALTMSIDDDGCGFKPETKPSHGLGTSIMKERAAQIGAQFNLQSEPGNGTHVQVLLGLPKEVQENSREQ